NVQRQRSTATLNGNAQRLTLKAKLPTHPEPPGPTDWGMNWIIGRPTSRRRFHDWTALARCVLLPSSLMTQCNHDVSWAEPGLYAVRATNLIGSCLTCSSPCRNRAPRSLHRAQVSTWRPSTNSARWGLSLR